MMLRLLIGLIVFFALSSIAGAQSPLEKLRLTYSAIGGSQATVWSPYDPGIFRKHGLDVELL
jgi:ABC-type nitrate/sulfonate/bicarbonate transport system substrate-binding protein